MKKLLTIFASTTIVMVPMTTLVSCGHKDHLENDSSILFEFNKQIDGNTKISINEKLLNDLLSSTTLQTRLTNDVIKLIKFGFLKKLSLDDETINKALEQNKEFLNDYSIQYAKKYFKILENNVVKNMERKRKSEGKKWNKFLMNRYPSYVKNEKKPTTDEINFLEEKYKFDQYFDSSEPNNIDELFNNIILKKQAITEFTKIDEVKSNINNFKKLLSEGKLIDTLRQENVARSNFICAYNSSENDINKWVTVEKNDFFTKDGEISSDNEKRIKNLIKDIKPNENYKFIPKNISEINQTNISNLLFLSNSQRFLFNRYYEAQAPVSISEVIYSFLKDKDFANGISENLFKDGGNDNLYIKEINQFFQKYIITNNDKEKNYTNQEWIKMLAQNSVDNDCGRPTIKKSDKLLSLGSDHSQELKNIVYDYLTSDKKYGTQLDKELKLETLIKKITRKKDEKNSFYGYLESDPSKIIYVASDGLHIVNIDGYQLLKKDDLFNRDAAPIDNTIKDGKINSKTIERFINFKTFEDNSSTNENTKVDAIQHLNLDKLDDPKNKIYNNLNNSINNKYLKFLINNSIVKGLKGTYTNFDLKSDVDSWLATEIKQDEDQAMKWSIYQVEYMKMILGEKDINKLIEMFVKFSDTLTNKLKPKIVQTIINHIMMSNNNLRTKYIRNNNNWKETIDKELKSTYPKLTFDLRQEDLQKYLQTIFQATPKPKEQILNYIYYKNGEIK